jgi:hypothetical protein
MIFQLNVLADEFHNIFSSVHLIFGKLVTSDDGREIEINEDSDGWHGKADLHFCTYIPTYMLFIMDPGRVQVAIRMSSDATSFVFKNDLGPMLDIFTVSLLDRDYVHLVASIPGHSLPNPSPLPAASDIPGLTRKDTYPLLTMEGEAFTTRFTPQEVGLGLELGRTGLDRWASNLAGQVSGVRAGRSLGDSLSTTCQPCQPIYLSTSSRGIW